jgi:NADH:ubiquinone oxidoreductase subunit E
MADRQGVRVDFASIQSIVAEKYNRDPENLIMILQEINGLYNYLPQEAIRFVASQLEIPLSQVYSAATFYKAFSLEPRGKYVINICAGTACHVRGAERIKESMEQKLNVQEGETTRDSMFTLESVRCLGCCALGPVLTVNGKVHGGLDRAKAMKLIDAYTERG